MFEDVSDNNYHRSNTYAVTCHNKCQVAPFEWQKVQNHVEVECPLTEVNCPLHDSGCEVRLPRKDMPECMKDAVTHLTLLATVTQRLLNKTQELQQNTEDLKKENQKHNEQLEVKKSTTEAHFYEQKTMEKEVEDLRKEVCELRLTFGFPINLHVNYTIKKEQYLPSFSTHSYGYRMCIRVDTNGYLSEKGTHVSIYTYLMQGSYDGHLKYHSEER